MDLNFVALLISAFTGAVVGIAGAVVSLRRLPVERKTAETEAVASLAKTYSELVGNLADELGRLENKIADLEEKDRAHEKRDRAHLEQIELLRQDIIKATVRIRKLETENQQLRETNHELVLRLAESDEKGRLLEEKLDTIIKNGQGGRGGASG